MITEQVRAALGAMKWSQQDLGDKCGFTRATIQRMTEGSGVPRCTAQNVDKAQTALEKGDDLGYVEFTKSGIIFHKRV